MKKKYILLLATAALITVAAIGGTLASGSVESGNVLQNISEKALGISIMSGNTKEGDGRTSISVEAVPGASNTLNYQIKNDRTNGYDLYARVDLYYGWSSDALADDQTRNSYVNLNLNNRAYPYVDSYAKQTKVGDWIVAYCDQEQMTLYYTKPLAQGEKAKFLDSVSFSTEMGNRYAGAQYLLDVEVTAVQANNSDEAIAAEWGVYPRFDSNGTITSVSETR